MYRHTNSHAGAHSVLIKFLAAFGHVNDLFPKTAVSLSTMLLPGVYSVIVPPLSVVVVVVVCDTCAHAKGAATANAMLRITFFIFPFCLLSLL